MFDLPVPQPQAVNGTAVGPIAPPGEQSLEISVRLGGARCFGALVAPRMNKLPLEREEVQKWLTASKCRQTVQPTFLVGRNSLGHWVARDDPGRCGGIFRNRTQALRFAIVEGRSGIVVQVNGVLELFSKSSGTQKAGGLAYLLEPPLSV